jgi:capsular exopolysaccharide synthesis family protein
MLFRFGEKYPALVQMKNEMDLFNKDITDYAVVFRKNLKDQVNAPLGAPDHANSGLSQMLQRSHKALVTQEKILADEVAQESAKLVAMGLKRVELQRAEVELAENRDRVKDLNAHLEDLETASSSKTRSRLVVIGYGNEKLPSKSSDRRLPMAVLCGLVGFGIPVLLAVGLSKWRRRYRYSDETDSKLGQPALLGILPTLPDHLADPEQAAVAAHCIHQIRIMLQVGSSLAGQEPKRVFMVTSANTGDGKTSLSMSLALSFAASGSRTLVIDCDMVGQGLTHRLHAGQSQGLHEALIHGTLQGRIKKTTTTNLYVLPIGGCEAVHAGSISPTAIKKLLLEAKHIFDTVVIDTGPVLGSLEATVVATVTDAVILTVSRGQNQALFERAVRHLRSVGAFIAGIVFNRAEKRDFNRSVGAASVRSTSYQPVAPRMLLGEGDEPSRFGPLARSVASFIPGINDASAKARAVAGSNGNGHGNGNGNGHGRGADAPVHPSIDDEININIDFDPEPDQSPHQQ